MQIFILVLYFVNILKTTELNTLKGSPLYVNCLRNTRQEGERGKQVQEKQAYTLIHSLDPVIPKAIFTSGLSHGIGQESPLSSLHWFGLSHHHLQAREYQLLLLQQTKVMTLRSHLESNALSPVNNHKFIRFPQIIKTRVSPCDMCYTRTFISCMIGGGLPQQLSQ